MGGLLISVLLHAVVMGAVMLDQEWVAKGFFIIGTTLAPRGFEAQILAWPINVFAIALMAGFVLWRVMKKRGPLKAEEWELQEKKEWWPSQPSE